MRSLTAAKPHRGPARTVQYTDPSTSRGAEKKRCRAETYRVKQPPSEPRSAEKRQIIFLARQSSSMRPIPSSPSSVRRAFSSAQSHFRLTNLHSRPPPHPVSNTPRDWFAVPHRTSVP